MKKFNVLVLCLWLCVPLAIVILICPFSRIYKWWRANYEWVWEDTAISDNTTSFSDGDAVLNQKAETDSTQSHVHTPQQNPANIIQKSPNKKIDIASNPVGLLKDTKPAYLPLYGILYNKDKPSILIDSIIAHEGDIVCGAKVIKIHQDMVKFEQDGKSWMQGVQKRPKTLEELASMLYDGQTVTERERQQQAQREQLIVQLKQQQRQSQELQRLLEELRQLQLQQPQQTKRGRWVLGSRNEFMGPKWKWIPEEQWQEWQQRKRDQQLRQMEFDIQQMESDIRQMEFDLQMQKLMR